MQVLNGVDQLTQEPPHGVLMRVQFLVGGSKLKWRVSEGQYFILNRFSVSTFTALARVPWSQYSMTMQREPPGPLNEVKYFTMLLWCRSLKMLISSLESFLGFWKSIFSFTTVVGDW